MKARAREDNSSEASEFDEDNVSLLRLLACGGADDGTSTLIARLLCDTKNYSEDQVPSPKDDVDRDHTSDIVYRYFATDRRRFVVADAPGREFNMGSLATGASTSDLAVLVVDARNGVLAETRRHASIVALFGIRHVVLAVNKIDLVGFGKDRFEEIRKGFVDLAERFAFSSAVAIPTSAHSGDNVTRQSELLPWYQGPTLLEYLESAEISNASLSTPFRFPVQSINSANATFRGYAGTLAAGRIIPGDEVVVPRTGQSARVERIATRDGARPVARVNDSVVLTLDREIDVERGDILAPPNHQPELSDQIAAHLIWMSGEELLPGRSYLFKAGGRTVGAVVSELKHRFDADSFKLLAAKTLVLNDIGFCNLSLAEPIAFDGYERNRTTGSFILTDRFTDDTVAIGMIRFGLRRASNIHWQAVDVDKVARAHALGQRPCILWFTGLSAAGKSTIANLVEKKLHLAGCHTYLLDGDNVRHGLNRDLGFTDADRVENIRRVAETAKLFADAGLIVLVSFISPFRSERDMARGLVEADEFLEVHVDVPLDVAEARDPKGLYKKARAGEIVHFTGIDSPYEPPLAPDIHLDTTRADATELAERIIARLREGGYLGSR